MTLSIEAMVLIALAGVCAVYAVVLEGFHNSYVPDGLIFVVGGGCGLVWLALAIEESYGVGLTAAHVLRAFVVGGSVMAIWQAWQFWNRRKGRKEGRR